MIHIEPQYFPNIQYFALLEKYQKVYFDDISPFKKQTLRNRCYIAGPNKTLILTVPVKKKNAALLLKDIRIDNSKRWQSEHLHSLRSAYGKSPFFIYYKDEIEPFFFKHYDFLLDLNMEITGTLKKLLQLQFNGELLSSANHSSCSCQIFTGTMEHQQSMNSLTMEEYPQVFSDRHGFIPHLSVLDLLFNLGNEAHLYIQRLTMAV